MRASCYNLSSLSVETSGILEESLQVDGITITQAPETVVKADMPESAIESGYIGFVLSPEEIGQELLRIAHAPPPKAT